MAVILFYESSTIVPVSNCPAGYTDVGGTGSCLKVFKEWATYDVAENRCRHEGSGARLAVAKTEKDINRILQLDLVPLNPGGDRGEFLHSVTLSI